jgi:FMN-dependent NADH-azoreductase
MSKLIYITANPRSEVDSLSLSVGRQFLNEYKDKHPQDEIVEIDTYSHHIPYIDVDVFNGWGKLQTGMAFESLSTDEKTKVSRINDLTEEFISGDKYVFVTPLWNFTIPPMMKAYIDTICIAGKTFKYTETGPVGLLNGKKALHIQASGGIYSQGPAASLEMGNKYIKTICNFLGIQDVQSIFIEGAAQTPDKASEIKEKAIDEARQLAAQF